MGPPSTDNGHYSDKSNIVSCSSHSSASDTQPSADLWPLGLVGGPDDRPFPTGKVLQEINNLLGKVLHREFSFGDIVYVLPILPGLSVTNVGTVSLPLREEMVEKLKFTAREESLNVWAIAPDLVEMKNDEWLEGLKSLCCISAEKLGYKDIILQPKLKKLLVVGPRGYRGKQIDWFQEAGSRSVATLLVQFPSEFTGGALVVRQEGGCEIRYELGKENAMAAFRPHYLVYTAGSSCEMEGVTSGYCLMMEYSLCLPSDLPLSLGRRVSEQMQHELAGAIKKLKGGPDAIEFDTDEPSNDTNENRDGYADEIAMFLTSTTFTKEQIEIYGLDRLTGVDKERLQFLSDANDLLPPERRLRFYFAHIRSVLKASNGKPVTSISWYLMNGTKVGDSAAVTRMNFLNPDNETLNQLWQTGEKNTCERSAIVMWPASADIVNRLTVIGIAAAVPAILEQGCLSRTTLRRLLKEESFRYYEFARDLQVSQQSVPLLAFCQKLCEAIVKVGNVMLVDSFVKKYFDQLAETEKTSFLSWFPILVERFGWAEVSDSIMSAIDCQAHKVAMDRALALAESLDAAPFAQAELTNFAVLKAQQFGRSNPEKLAYSKSMSLLWKHAILCDDSSKAFDKVKNLFVADAKRLGPVVDALSKIIDGTSLPLHKATLITLAWTRRQWLINEIMDCQKPFPWQILNANFVQGPGIVSFLQGPERTLVLKKFTGMSQARFLVAILNQSIKGPLDITLGVGEDREVFVQIQKTGGEFDPRREKMSEYMAEILRLGHLLLLQAEASVGNENARSQGNTAGRKRALSSATDVITID